MKNTEKDICLIQKTIKGNREAENYLYAKYKKIVSAYILKKYSEYYDLDDDVSEIMVRIFTKLSTYNPNKSKFKTWVLSITKNYLIDKWRQYQSCITYSAGNTITLDGSVSISNFVTSDNTGEIVLNGNTNITASNDFENINTLNYVSTQMDSVDFQLLDMKYSMGYSYNEIGAEFNISSNTVSNRVNYVKSKIQKTNKEEIFDQ